MSAHRLPKWNFFLLTWNRASKDQPVVKKTAQDWARLYDYLQGAAQAINPLPPTIWTVHLHSDAEALHSDWKFVWSDIDAGYKASIRRREC